MSGAGEEKPRAFDIPRVEETHPASSTPRTAPRAFNLEEVTLADEAAETLDASPAMEIFPKPGFRWLSLFVAALGLLASLGVGLAVDSLIRELFIRNPWLGWFGSALAALAALAASAIVLREILALKRLRRIGVLRLRAEDIQKRNDKILAETLERDLAALYEGRVDMAAERAALAVHKGEIVDGRGKLLILERDLLGPLDTRADTLVMNAARRVAIVTAISPRALVDVLYVLVENLRLIRALSALYGARPGFIGFMRLIRAVMGHLAVTGALAAGDGLMQQIVGHGLAARLSSRFGEGVVNGLLTARIGLAAHDLCRPIPFLHKKRPGIGRYMNALLKLNAMKDKP